MRQIRRQKYRTALHLRRRLTLLEWSSRNILQIQGRTNRNFGMLMAVIAPLAMIVLYYERTFQECFDECFSDP